MAASARTSTARLLAADICASAASSSPLTAMSKSAASIESKCYQVRPQKAQLASHIALSFLRMDPAFPAFWTSISAPQAPAYPCSLQQASSVETYILCHLRSCHLTGCLLGWWNGLGHCSAEAQSSAMPTYSPPILAPMPPAHPRSLQPPF